MVCRRFQGMQIVFRRIIRSNDQVYAVFIDQIFILLFHKSDNDVNLCNADFMKLTDCALNQPLSFDFQKRIQVEIQIRTMAMDFWATIEHSLQYKYKANIPDHIRERLSAAAKAIIVLDNEMSSVRSEIMDAQNSSQMQRNLITDILNNIENLYKVTNKREVEKIQDEFYHIYAQNDLQELKRFHKELDLIAEGYRAQAITDEL